MDYRNWMKLNTGIHDRQLKQICLPMTHDTGTYGLTDVLCPYDYPIFSQIEAAIAELVEELTKLGVPPSVDPAATLLAEAIGAVKGLATATQQDVAAQLDAGIRGFDLRVSYDPTDSTFKTFHGLWGAPIPEILDQIAAFLGATQGEIVYLNMSHFSGIDAGLQEQFNALVLAKLGHWGYYPTWSGGAITNDVFSQTYSQIIGSSNTSKVILVNDVAPAGDPNFWPAAYCPPDDTKTSFAIDGVYTNTESVSAMLSAQTSQYQQAVDAGMPFALYMTLTPSTTTYVEVVGFALSGAVVQIGEDLVPIDPVIGAAVIAFGAGLKFADILLPFNTLLELSQDIDRQLDALVIDNFLPISPGSNQISMIFLDFFETTAVVDLAIQLSNDFVVEWSSSQTIEAASGDTIDPLSNEGPAAAVFEEVLHVVYKGHDTDDIWECRYQTGQGWYGNEKIGGDSFSLETDKSPALAVFDRKLYMVYKGDDNELCQAVYSAGAWGAGQKIKDISEIDPKTNNSPYLAVFEDLLYLAYKGESDDIRISTLAAGGQWSGNQKIGDIPDSTISPGTNKRPGLCVHNGVLYMMYKEGNGGDLRQATLSGGVWSGDQKIDDLNDDAISPKSTEGPALARYAGILFMVYKGESDHIWESQRLDEWGGNEKLADLSDGAINPETNRAPYLARVGNELWLLHKDNDSDSLMVTILAPKRY